MERIMSTRIDESVAALIDRIAREKKLTKKKIIEEAIKNFWHQIKGEKELDIFQDSFVCLEKRRTRRRDSPKITRGYYYRKTVVKSWA